MRAGNHMRMLIFGLGFTGTAMARAVARAGWDVAITTRGPIPAMPDGVRVIAFEAAEPEIARATHAVSTVPPPGDGGEEADAPDPVLHTHGGALAAAAELRWLGYLSTTGVYGDRDGAWVDEESEPAPGQPRSRRRLAAEQAWRTLADRRAVDLFRVAGIYGPGRSPLDDVRAGRARRVDKPGHAFGRIHRDDIAAAVLAAAAQDRPPGVRVLHLSDDTPAAQADVVAEAARLLGVPPPPLVPYAEAAARMGEMGRSFWTENRRVSSARTRAALSLDWRYPSYREGLAGILAEETAQRAAEQREVGGT